ncbi:SPOR domain-containing protein [Luteimonas sp. MC1750]|uniref:SPOR domain-containing protein n=1 Tax=Luteimonas sp. MC1750 TaxID=2799326 RepID=UPI0018F0E41C|nr:SPOR domain-containing protein [Luteimonas sp. MC1750]MBJ6985742.1 SPOR domain-containing protein [Luteimonas sp. MC1750]QQO06063.1 SPOR domain-containing protein [Luteimonas sp. MC1750]
MAVKRGKSQARRNSGSSASLPGWAWMIIGVLLTIVVVMAAPKLLKSGSDQGFFRPTPNPDATPAVASPEAGESVADDAPAPTRPSQSGRPQDDAAAGTQYDFYTLLPGQEVAMTDAELAASARAEQERQAELLARERAAQQRELDADAAELAADAPAPAATPTRPATPAPAATATPAAAPAATASAPAADGVRYILQAGSFASNTDAEALKARIAMLGLVARVEQADIDGRAMYRVRMGPYGTASELAEAKQKLGNGGLEALAIRAR